MNNIPAAVLVATLGCSFGSAHAGLAADPALPAYGQSVAVELRDTSWPMFLPATRYSRSGGAIDIDYDYLTDGFGPMRADFGEQPLSLGQLAPGNYQVRARLHDIAKPSAAPIEYSMQIAVMPPIAWGIYLLPTVPQAFAATQVIVRSAAFLDPASMKASVSGNVVRVEFDYRDDAPATGATPPGMSTFGSVAIPSLAPGAYFVEGWGRTSPDDPYENFFRRAFSVASTAPVIEFYSAVLGHYFIAAGADEIALLERGGQGDWKRSGQQFSAWVRAADAPTGASPVCRFYARGPNSHFYTGSRQECDYLKALEAQQRAESSARGEAFLGWAYEAIAFWAVVPQAGLCPGGMSPVYRAYNDRAAQMDSNHRFMMDAQQRDAMSVGWLDEGVQLCSAA
jgi:hypothetical protein